MEWTGVVIGIYGKTLNTLLQAFSVRLLTPYNPAMPDDKRPRGRPPVPPEEKLVPITFKVKPKTKVQFDKYGSSWARGALERAKPPREPED